MKEFRQESPVTKVADMKLDELRKFTRKTSLTMMLLTAVLFFSAQITYHPYRNMELILRWVTVACNVVSLLLSLMPSGTMQLRCVYLGLNSYLALFALWVYYDVVGEVIAVSVGAVYIIFLLAPFALQGGMLVRVLVRKDPKFQAAFHKRKYGKYMGCDFALALIAILLLFFCTYCFDSSLFVSSATGYQMVYFFDGLLLFSAGAAMLPYNFYGYWHEERYRTF